MGSKMACQLLGVETVSIGDVLPPAKLMAGHSVAFGNCAPNYEAVDAFGVASCEIDGDETAHGSTMDMGPLDSEMIQQPDQVLRPTSKAVMLVGAVTHPVTAVVIIEHREMASHRFRHRRVPLVTANRASNLDEIRPRSSSLIPDRGSIDLSLGHSDSFLERPTTGRWSFHTGFNATDPKDTEEKHRPMNEPR